MDSIIEVVRCFENSNIIHVDGVINPINDIEIIELELIYADLETVSKRRERVKKQLKADKSLANEDLILEKIEKTLNEGKSARSIEFTKEEKEIIKGSVKYKDTVLEEGEKDYFDSEGGLTEFISNGIDNAELPDAFYEVSYYYGAKGYRSGSGVSLKIQNHKLISYEKNKIKKF